MTSVRYAIFEDAGPTSKSAEQAASLTSTIRFVTAGEAEAERHVRPKPMRLPTMPLRLISQTSLGNTDGDAWGIEAVGAMNGGGAGVCVAVLDSGIDKNHPAFKHLQFIEE